MKIDQRDGAVPAALWGAVLAVLVIVNACFGSGILVLLMFASAVVLAGLFAAAVRLWTRRHSGRRPRWSVPARTTSGVMLGAAAVLAGLGGVYTLALIPPALWVAGMAVRALRRERVRPDGDGGYR